MKPKKKGDHRKDKKIARNKNEQSEKANSEVFSKVGQITPTDNCSKCDNQQMDGQSSSNTSSTELPPKTEITENAYDKKKYSKRQIKSNWSKYDLPAEEGSEEEPGESNETTATRGHDFLFLRSIGGGVGSQFRFQDEKDWTDDVDLANHEYLNHFQTLDTRALSQSMSCIPLQKRLGISTEYFTVEQIKHVETVAIANQKLFQQWNSQTYESIQQTPDFKPLNVADECATVVPVLKADCETEDSDLHSTKSSVNHNHVKAATPKEPQSSKPQNKTNATKILSKNSESENASELEDELDVLLSLRTTKLPLRVDATPPPTLDDDSNIKLSQPQIKMPEISDLPKQKIEDWLDDILCD